EYNLPFSENKKKAQTLPNEVEIQNFCEILREELKPWTERFKTQLTVMPINLNYYLPWQGILVSTSENNMDISSNDWLG
ncbi:hypothetical protein R7J40_19710, partial [Acinetobacter baumannii]|nr:hypothetical protein [Acinetobacter baumannii]